MNWTRRSAGLIIAGAMVIPVAACTTVDTAIDCAAPAYTFQDTSYREVPDAVFTSGKKLGVATSPTCDDTGAQDKSDTAVTKETAYRVDGVSPEVAIAVGDTPETARLVAIDSDSGLPPEVRKLIDGS
ncbi:DUF6281 family protein [Streptomyces sp. NBC_00247]|uniref:DUF6281 family protein n=1 Tax=Streptomyces sp. NBC_00247 TaxID=2975689 RepID=UPI002E2CEF3B|nr:DUF6281 family protein [Streptomyces sp. NBC_00247]